MKDSRRGSILQFDINLLAFLIVFLSKFLSILIREKGTVFNFLFYQVCSSISGRSAVLVSRDLKIVRPLITAYLRFNASIKFIII